MLLLMLSFAAAVERHLPVGSGIDTGHIVYAYAKHGKRDNNE